MTIREAFGQYVHCGGHSAAQDVRAHEPELWARATWKFAFVRDPWDRMFSLYWHGGGTATMPFDEWCVKNKHRRGAGDLLTDDDGELLVDTVYRFEDYASALLDIEARVGVTPPWPIHANRPNPLKPPGSCRHLYTPEARDRIAEISAWEIERYGYRWD